MRKVSILIAVLFTWQHISAQVFTSPDKSFSIALPPSWAEYDSEEEGTYAFFNPTRDWTGNLRMTPLKGQKEGGDLGATVREIQLEKYPGARTMKLGNLDVVTYTSESLQDNTALVIYSRVTGNKTTALICTFTIEKKDQRSIEMKNELKIVENIISNIKFL